MPRASLNDSPVKVVLRNGNDSFEFFRLPAKSARGLAHSTTLRVFRESLFRAQRLGLRWPSTAFSPSGFRPSNFEPDPAASHPKNLVCRRQVCNKSMHHAHAPRLFPAVPIVWNQRVFALGMVFCRCLFHQPGQRLLFSDLERAGMPFAVPYRFDTRIRPLACLPAGGRTGESNRALAAWRRSVCLPATTSRRPTLEHRRRTAGERGAGFPSSPWCWMLSHSEAGWQEAAPNLYRFIESIWTINIGLLVFNLMPVYPLDGGQILRSLLWFVFGRARSLMDRKRYWLHWRRRSDCTCRPGCIHFGSASWATFILMNCWSGLLHARALARIAKMPRREGFACPVCQTAPPQGALWRCGKCRNAFNTFVTQGVCPNCGTQFASISCPECGNQRPMSEWMAASNVPPKL